MLPLFIACIQLAFAEVAASGCCTPDQWEGYQPAYGGYSGHHHMRGEVKEFSAVSYDYTNKRKAVFMTFLNGDKQNKYQVITRCDDDNDDGCKVYVIDLQKNECRIKEVPGFEKSCIPADGKYNGNGAIGFGKNSMKIVSYVISRREVTTFVSVGNIGKDLCVPVSETIAGEMKGVGFMQYVGFIDISAGIKNATVFDVPDICDNMAGFEISLEAAFERSYFILAV